MKSLVNSRLQTYAEETKTVAQKWRDKIQGSNILHRLIIFAEGNTEHRDYVEYSPAQCATGLKLIGKIMPDLSSVQHDVSIDTRTLNIHELNSRLASLGYEPEQVWNQLSGNDQNVIEHDQQSEGKNGTTIDLEEPPPPDAEN